MSTDEASAPFRFNSISGDCSKEGRERGRRERESERKRERERERERGLTRAGLVHVYVLLCIITEYHQDVSYMYLLWCMHVELSLLGVEIESVPFGGKPCLLTVCVHIHAHVGNQRALVSRETSLYKKYT